MLNQNPICVFDFETDSPNPFECNPTQLSAVIIEPRKLEIIKDSEFDSFICPPTLEDDNYFEEHKKTIAWHAGNMNNTPEQVVNLWRNAPTEKDVFHTFLTYLSKYHKVTSRQSKFSAPIPCGHNINRFDMVIFRRLAQKYHEVDKQNDLKFFHPRDIIDTMSYLWGWMENRQEPNSLAMDVLCPYLGLSTKGAHNSLVDVKNSAQIFIRFLTYQRNLSKGAKFKNAFK